MKDQTPLSSNLDHIHKETRATCLHKHLLFKHALLPSHPVFINESLLPKIYEINKPENHIPLEINRDRRVDQV